MQYSTTSFNGRGPVHVPGQGPAFGTIETAEVGNSDPLVGKKVWTRWPEDNSFYEAVITDYNHVEVFLKCLPHNITHVCSPQCNHLLQSSLGSSCSCL